MDFSKALSELKEGKLIQRKGWNGKGMYAYYIANNYTAIPMAKAVDPDDYMVRDGLGLFDAKGNFGSWTPVAIDILAHDWQIVV